MNQHHLISTLECMLQPRVPHATQGDACAVISHLIGIDDGRFRANVIMLLRMRPRGLGAKSPFELINDMASWSQAARELRCAVS